MSLYGGEMAKHFVVTGGAGFIGSNLTLELQKQHPDADITVIDDFRSAHFKNLETYKGDLIAMDVGEIDLNYYFDKKKIDVVFHLASITDTTEHDQLFQAHDNIEGWRNVLDTFAGSKTRIVYASSAATYGIATGINKPEQTPRPANIYAFTKVQLDNLARRWLRENSKQTIVGLRYFNVYGPREAHKGAAASMMYQLAQQMKKGQRPRIFKAGEQKRDFVYVADIVSMTVAAAAAKKSGIYNAGSGEPRSFNEVVENLNRVMGTKLAPDYIENPYPFYQPHTQADISATVEALKVKPRFSLEKGIDDYFKSGLLAA